MFMSNKIHRLLGFEEGFKKKPYHCSEGYPTIGKGTRIGPKGAPLHYYQLSVTEAIADMLLEEELRVVRNGLERHQWYNELNEDRQVVILSMGYQLGLSGLFKFKRMITALETKDFEKARKEALDSKWAAQTPERAQRQARVLLMGDLMPTYAGLI